MNLQITPCQKRFTAIVIATLLTTLAYYAPFVVNAFRGFNPELRFVGDLQLAGFPAFIQAGKYFSSWTYFGQDFFTGNGASSLFARPNFSTYYLPQLILQTVFRSASTPEAAQGFTLLMWIDGFMAMLFTTLWLNRLMKVRLYVALLGGALVFSICGYIYYQISFLHVASVFPVLMFSLTYALLHRTSLLAKMLLSVPVVMIVTAGYVPLAVMGICVAMAGSVMCASFVKTQRLNYAAFISVLAIGGIVLASYFLTILNAVAIAPALPKMAMSEGLYFSDLSLTPRRVLSLFFAGIPSDSSEATHFRLGLPILLLVYLSFSAMLKSNDGGGRNLFILCLLFFAFSILLGLGRYSGLADIFFYTVPGLGSMHIYARYMLISVFFLVFAITLGMSRHVSQDLALGLKLPAIMVGIGFMLVLLLPQLFHHNEISIPVFFVELIVCTLMLLVFSLRGHARFLLLLIPILVAHQGSLSYVLGNAFSLDKPGDTSRDIVNSAHRSDSLVNYFYANARDKLLVKYIDITPELEKPGGIPQNFPWFVRYPRGEARRISSYLGYDQGLAHQLEYAQRFSFFGKYDKAYLAESGADYVIYDRKTQEKEKDWLASVVDTNVPEFDAGNGYYVAKLVSRSASAQPGAVVGNGVFDISSSKRVAIADFRTNWATKADITFTAESAGKLTFQLFPHVNWRYFLDDAEVQPVLSTNGLASFTFDSGDHRFSLRYRNMPMRLFLSVYLVYLCVIGGVIAWYAICGGRNLWSRRLSFVQRDVAAT